MTLTVSLLGPPRVERDGAPVSFDTRKATALLAHLALAERPHSRDALCELLWPGPRPGARARRPPAHAVDAAQGHRRGVARDDARQRRPARGPALDLDVRRFRSLTGGTRPAPTLAGAVELFGGDLLEGFGLRDSPEFDAWQRLQADALRRELAAALARLATRGRRGRSRAAIRHARRWLELDPLHEPAHVR